jgi:DNA-3-methyladenine glycosylase II
MFSLRRPDVLPVGDLGVQKGLLRWALAGHNALPPPKGKLNAQAAVKYKANASPVKGDVRQSEDGEMITLIEERPSTPTADGGLSDPFPPTPLTPSTSAPQLAALHTPRTSRISPPNGAAPPTPFTPGAQAPAQSLQIPGEDLPPSSPHRFLGPPSHVSWDPHKAVPLDKEGLSIELLKSRLGGKKAK